MRFWQLLSRALRLRCPICGETKLFRGMFTMHKQCDKCGTTFEREPGFFLGSIYINYGLTALLVAIFYPILLFSNTVKEMPLLLGCFLFTILFPLVLFRHSRSIWLGFDEWYDSRSQYEKDGSAHHPEVDE